MKGSVKFFFLALAILFTANFVSAYEYTICNNGASCNTTTNVLTCNLDDTRDGSLDHPKLTNDQITSFWGNVATLCPNATTVNWVIRGRISTDESTLYLRDTTGRVKNKPIQWNIQITKCTGTCTGIPATARLQGTNNTKVLEFTDDVYNLTLNGQNSSNGAVISSNGNDWPNVVTTQAGRVNTNISGALTVQDGGGISSAYSINATGNISVSTADYSVWSYIHYTNPNDQKTAVHTLQSSSGKITLNKLAQLYSFKGTITATNTSAELLIKDGARINIATDGSTPSGARGIVNVNVKSLQIIANAVYLAGIAKLTGNIVTDSLIMAGNYSAMARINDLDTTGGGGALWSLTVNNGGNMTLTNSADIIGAPVDITVAGNINNKIDNAGNGGYTQIGNAHQITATGTIYFGGNVVNGNPWFNIINFNKDGRNKIATDVTSPNALIVDGPVSIINLDSTTSGGLVIPNGNITLQNSARIGLNSGDGGVWGALRINTQLLEINLSQTAPYLSYTGIWKDGGDISANKIIITGIKAQLTKNNGDQTITVTAQNGYDGSLTVSKGAKISVQGTTPNYERISTEGDLTIDARSAGSTNNTYIDDVKGGIIVGRDLSIYGNQKADWAYLYFKNGTTNNITVGGNLRMDNFAQIYYFGGTQASPGNLNVTGDLSLNNCARINLTTGASAAYEEYLNINAKKISITEPNNDCWTSVRLGHGNVNTKKLYMTGHYVQLLSNNNQNWGDISVTKDATDPTNYDGSIYISGSVDGGEDGYSLKNVRDISCENFTLIRHEINVVQNITINGNAAFTNARILNLGNNTATQKTFWVKGNTTMVSSLINSEASGQDIYKFDGDLSINGNRDDFSLENPDHITVGGNLTLSNNADLVRMNQTGGSTKGISVTGNLNMTDSRILFNKSGLLHVGGNLNVTGTKDTGYSIFDPYKIEVGGNLRFSNADVVYFNDAERTGAGIFINGVAEGQETFISEYTRIHSTGYQKRFPVIVTKGDAKIDGRKFGGNNYPLVNPSSIRVNAGSLTVKKGVGDAAGRVPGVWAQYEGEIYARDNITFSDVQMDGWNSSSNIHGITSIEAATGNITMNNASITTVNGIIKAVNGTISITGTAPGDVVISDWSVTGLRAKQIILNNAEIYDITYWNAYPAASGYGQVFAQDKLTMNNARFWGGSDGGWSGWGYGIHSVLVNGIAGQDSIVLNNSGMETWITGSPGTSFFSITLNNGNFVSNGAYLSSNVLVYPSNIDVKNGNFYMDAGDRAKFVINGMKGSIHASGDITFKNSTMDGYDGGWDIGNYPGITGITTDNGNVTFDNVYLRTLRGTIKAPRNPTDDKKGIVSFSGTAITDDLLSDYSAVSIDANGFTVTNGLLLNITYNEPYKLGGRIDVAGTISLTNAQITASSTEWSQNSRRLGLIKAKNMTMDGAVVHYFSHFGKPATEPYNINITGKLEIKNGSRMEYLSEVANNDVTKQINFKVGDLVLNNSSINWEGAGVDSYQVGKIDAGSITLTNQSKIWGIGRDITIDNYLKSTDSSIYFNGPEGEQRKIIVNSGGNTTANNGKAIYIKSGLSGDRDYTETDPMFALTYHAPLAIYNNNLDATSVLNNTGIDSSYYGGYKAELFSCDLSLENTELRYDSGDPGLLINKKDTATLDGTLQSFNGSKNTIQKWDVCGATPAQSCVSLTANPSSYSENDNGTSTATITATLQGAFGSGATTKITCNAGETTQTVTDVAIASGKATTTCTFTRDGSNHSIEARVNNSTVVCPQTFFSYGSGPGTGGPAGPVATILYISSYITDMAGTAIPSGTVSITDLGLEAGEVCPTVPITFNISDGKAEGTINCDKLGVGKTRTATATITGSGKTDSIQITYKT